MAVKLEKTGQKYCINLKKESIFNKKEILINLNWSQNVQKKSFLQSLFGKNEDIDLDLGCYYELNNGERMVIDGVQFSHGRGGTKDQRTNQGCYTDVPFIWHQGDDRGNTDTNSGENIFVNPKGIGIIKKMIIYAFIYEGVPHWSETNAIVTVKVPGNEEIIVEMGKQDNKKNFCAIAELNFTQDSITVKKLVTFHTGHRDCDKYYNWGFQWQAGGKD